MDKVELNPTTGLPPYNKPETTMFVSGTVRVIVHDAHDEMPRFQL